MKTDYQTLKSLPENFGFPSLFRFLSKTKNASLRPDRSDVESDTDLPPVLFWWFEENNEEVNQVIKNAVADFPWEEEWIIEDTGNKKWLLYPKRTREVQKMLDDVEEGQVKMTRDSSIWLKNNGPDFGRRTNKDLLKFRKYFRSVIENYLKEKEGIS